MTTADFKTECNRRRAAGLILRGNTYPIKDQIKTAGGIWDGVQKAWLMPDAETMTALASKMEAAPAPARAPATSRPRNWSPCGYPGCHPSYCDECDGKGYQSASRGRW